MSNDWIITSGYTVGTPYFNDAVGLLNSCIRLGIYCEIIPYNSFGSWGKNNNYKASLILYAMRRQYGVNIIWVDADAVVLCYPSLFDDWDCDIGVYHPEWPINSGRFLCSTGTLFLKNTPQVIALVTEWVKLVAANPACEEYHVFECLINKEFKHLNIAVLPPEYCMVVAPDPVPDCFKPWITKPGPIRDDVKMDDVVIMHTWGGARHGGSTPKR